MIARIWSGAVRRDDGDAYQAYMQATGIPGYASTAGNRGVLMLRRDENDKCEVVMISLWDSMDAIIAFAGSKPEEAVFYPEDDRYLIARDLTVKHFEVATALGFPGA
jgi:heme-degrading monooxygenase HmoA